MGFAGQLFGDAINAAKRGINTMKTNMSKVSAPIAETVAKPAAKKVNKLNAVKGAIGTVGIIGAAGTAYMMSKKEDTNYNKEDATEARINELEQL